MSDIAVPKNGYPTPFGVNVASVFKVDARLAALTLSRLLLVPVIVLTFLKAPSLTSVAIIAFVVADIYDGVLARRNGSDGPWRRALDSSVDRIGIDAGMVGAYVAGLLPLPLLMALIARDLYCAAICGRMLRRRGVAIKADWVYRSLNVFVAAGALAAPFLPPGLWVALTGGLLLAAIVVAIDLTRLVGSVESASPRFRDVVVPAGEIRAMLS
jgi:phosphatidylglycerophosphate synthase